MRVPGATYRVQLNKDFSFEHARALVPFLHRLGITDLYFSPVFQARGGSMHGYDVTDPSRLNNELGTEQEFDLLVDDLHSSGMHLLVDIVPNHMATSSENPWWMDVLENGPASEYAAYFDIEWGHQTPSVQDKILIPILGEPYGSALESRKLQLGLYPAGFRIGYYATQLPVDPACYHGILSHRLSDLLGKVDASEPPLREFGLLLELAERLPARSVTDWEEVEARRRDTLLVKAKLWEVYTSFPIIREFIEHNLHEYNGTEGDARSFNLLDNLIAVQPYQLTYWKVARERINYRRFFDVSDLVAIRTQDPQVFEATHALVACWLQHGKVSGLRIDHIDGLYEPLAYLSQLQTKSSGQPGAPFYIVVEKILSGDETLPVEWPVAGTTGYDFLGVANNLFVHPAGLNALDTTYAEFIGRETQFAEVAYASKKKIIHSLFAVEIQTLALHLGLLADRYRHSRDLSPRDLTHALTEVTASLPVYRTYTREHRVSARDRIYIEDALANGRKRNPDINGITFDFLRKVLLLQFEDDEDTLRFVMRWQQITGPIMAKGVEDTTLYLYHRLISMNEVGGSPVPVSPERFHDFNIERHVHWTGTINASSTHDTKRSEDVRARINLLSEMADQWTRYVNRWHRWNSHKLGWYQGEAVPDPNEEYLLYQTLVGAWPLGINGAGDFTERIKNYMVKAVREGKTHSSWLNQNHEYESLVTGFVDAILEDGGENAFLVHLRRFHERIAFYGAINSLSQTLLKMTCPGVPDFYQGTTGWDFSLVDPDNRRPVQLPAESEWARNFSAWDNETIMEVLRHLLLNWSDGGVKSFLIFKTLRFRNENPNLFLMGEYMGLRATGLGADHSVAFARRCGDEWAIVLVPRFLTSLTALEKMPLGRRFWKDSAIRLPDDAPVTWRNILTGETVAGSLTTGIQLSDALRLFPVAVLSGQC
ncbi:MAG: malto-oligosyltrehalose synthase [Bryobacteraceae bacterium]